MIYFGLKGIFKYAIHQYFSDIKVIHKERIPLNTPIMILPNHRSAFMDPIVVSTLLKPEMHFLARGEQFTSSFMSKIYARINMIPIYRKQYSPDEVHKNEDVFRHCYQLLEQKGALMIYPEGLCQTQFILSPLKTGAARIALGAEQKNNYMLGLKMLPIGINYSNPHRFRSRVVLDIGEAIDVSDYKDLYNSAPEEAVVALTQRLESDLTSLIITLHNDHDASLIRRTELLFDPANEEGEVSEESWYKTRKIIAGGVNYFRKENPLELDKFGERVTNYLSLAGIDDPKGKKTTGFIEDLRIKNKWLQLAMLVLLFPIFLLGIITHGLPYLLTRKLALGMVKRTDFTGSVMLALGLLIFSIFGIFESYMLHSVTKSWFFTTVFFLMWPSLGIFTYSYFLTAHQYIRVYKQTVTSKNLTFTKQYLDDERQAILKILTNAYDQYRQHIKTTV